MNIAIHESKKHYTVVYLDTQTRIKSTGGKI